MLNNIYKEKGLKSPNKNKYRSNTFLESLNKPKQLDLISLKHKNKKNFVVDSGGNDQFSPHMFGYNSGRMPFGRTSNKNELDIDKATGFMRDRGDNNRNVKNFTQEQFMSHKPNRKAGLSLSRAKYASPIVPSLNKNFMVDDANFKNNILKKNSQTFRGAIHYKNSSNFNVNNLELSHGIPSRKSVSNLKGQRNFHEQSNDSNKYFTSRKTKNKESSKRGTLYEKIKTKKGKNIVSSLRVKANLKSTNLTRKLSVKGNALQKSFN